MNAAENKSRIVLSVAVFVAAFAALCVHARRYLPFLSDDALISLRYAKRLVEGHGLTWNAGERVEGYSNLLWVLCAGAVNWLGADLVVAVRALGYVCMGAAIVAVLYAHPPRTMKGMLPITLALLFLPLAGASAAWTIGGMEQPLVAALLAWGVVLCYPLLERGGATWREMLAPGLCFALLCWTRLDSPVFVAAAVAAIFLIDGINRDALRKAAGLALLPVVFCLLQVVFRLVYYGELIPNTALVKFAPSGKHALDGWGYLRAGAFTVSPLIAVAVASAAVALLKNFMRARAVFLSALVIAWAAYLVAIGGDIFPAWRHFVPLVVLLVLLACVGAEWVAARSGRVLYAVANVSCALLLALFFFLQLRDEENYRAITERWEWDGEPVGLMLKRAFGEAQPLMAVDPAGALPYWSELPTLDMLGLNDHYLPRHPPPGLGAGPIGHELGDGKYVLDRAPDLVVFLLPTGSDRGYFLSGRQMQEDPRFFRDYRLVWFEARAPRVVRARIWVRRYSERIGIRRTPDETLVPGFLLCDNPATITYLDAEGRLVVPVRRDMPARARDLELRPGRWRLEVEATKPSLAAGVTAGEGGRIVFDPANPTEFEVSGAGPSVRVNVELIPNTTETIEVRRLTFTRVLQ